MPIFVDDVFELLNTPSGSLAYHLVITFALLIALGISITHFIKNNTVGNRRILVGIGFLFLLKITLILIIGLIDQNIFGNPNFLPEINRLFDVFSLFTLFGIWIFSFPKSNPISHSLFIWLIILSFGILLVFLWLTYSPPILISENFYLPYTNLFLIILLYIGIILLYSWKPKNWILGLTMFFIMFFGELGQTLMFSNQSDYPSFFRILQFVSLPLLYGISFDKFEEISQFEQSEFDSLNRTIKQLQAAENVDIHAERLINTRKYLETFLNLSKLNSINSPEKSLVLILANAFIVDIVLIISAPDHENNSRFISGYDLITEKFFKVDNATKFEISGLEKGFQYSTPLIIKKNQYILKPIAKILDLIDLGSTLLVPIINNKDNFCIIFANPYTNHQFNKSEIELINNSSKKILRYLEEHQINIIENLDKLNNGLEDRSIKLENENKHLVQEISENKIKFQKLELLIRNSVIFSNIIDEALNLILDELQEKNLSLRTNLPEDLAEIYTDRDTIFEIVSKLIIIAVNSSLSNETILVIAKNEKKLFEEDIINFEINLKSNGDFEEYQKDFIDLQYNSEELGGEFIIESKAENRQSFIFNFPRRNQR